MNAARERAANRIVTVCVHLLQRWADFMQRFTERLSRNGKLIILSLFCMTAGSLSLYLIVSSVISRKASSFNVSHLKIPSYVDKSGDENAKAVVTITKNEFEKIQRFRIYMDSLARSPSGRKVHDSILNQRPHLMDSIFFLLSIYQSQSKN